MYARIGRNMLNFLANVRDSFALCSLRLTLSDDVLIAWTPTKIDERLEPQVCNRITEY